MSVKMKYVNNTSKINEFFKQAPKVEPNNNPPKFQIGDYIINTKFKVISKIVDIIDIFENEDRSVNYTTARYVMLDIKNEAREKYIFNTGLKMPKNVKKYNKRYKYAHYIDAFYKKINPEAAQALYGIKVNNEGNSDDY